jgi:hypothetical protein
MKFNTSHIAAVLAVSGVVLFGATTATAGGSPAIPDGSVWQSDIAKPVNDLYMLGRGSVVKEVSGKIGGRSTVLSTFDMTAGTWLITINATFIRIDAAPNGATKTRPQLQLKFGPEGDQDAGTIKGADLPLAKGGDLASATVRTVTLTRAHNLFALRGAGLNDDGSIFTSGKIFVRAQITATRIG